jgi:hypothetical protein
MKAMGSRSRILSVMAMRICWKEVGAVPGDAHAFRLFQNPGNGNDWINIKLVGVKSNRSVIGARIKVTVEK